MIMGIYRPLIPPKLFLSLCLSLNKNKISYKIENADIYIFNFPENQSGSHEMVPILLWRKDISERTCPGGKPHRKS